MRFFITIGMLLIALLCLPYIFVFTQLSSVDFPFPLFFKYIPNNILQASVSALLTLLMSVLGSYGLGYLRLNVPRQFYAVCEFLCLLPSVLPSLFLIVATLNVVPSYPFNMLGVVILHVLGQIGISSVIVRRLFDNRLSCFADTVILYSNSKWYFLRTVWPIIIRDLFLIFGLLFVFFLTSFSIPLIIGGTDFTTLEVLIYKYITTNNNWSVASGLVFLQFCTIIFLLTILDRAPRFPNRKTTETTDALLLSSGWGSIVFVVPLFILSYGFVSSVPAAINGIRLQPDVFDNLFAYFLGSLLLGFLTAGFCFVLLSAMSLISFQFFFKRLFSSLLTPSYVAIAFGFLFIVNAIEGPLLLSTSCCVTLSLLPSLYRLGVLQKVEFLQDQYEMGFLMSGSHRHTLFAVVYPQLLPIVSLLSGLAGFWAIGDYSMSRVLSGQDIHLAMWTQSLIEQYRWDFAVFSCFAIVLAGAVVFLFFWSMSYVFGQKLIQ